MSGGFFRGTSADQDTRFSNKQAKLLKTQKFAPELEHLVEIAKVKMDVIKPWIAKRVTELLGFEDEVLINFIYGLLEGKEINGKQVQIQLTGFMEKNTGKFMKELWTLLLSAQNNASGVPQQFLDAKEEETKKKKAETDRIFNELQRRREMESKEFEHEKARKMDGGHDDNSAEKRRAQRGPDTHSGEENGAGVTNGFRGRKRSSKSPYSSDRSASPHRNARSRSISKSRSNSRSYSKERSISRSISVSPRARRRSISPDRIHRSPRRRSVTPRRQLTRESISPRHRSHSGRRSSSYGRYRSPSPVRRRVRSPVRRRSPSPFRRRSPSPARRRSPSPFRRRSRSPVRRRSPSPRQQRLPSPRRRQSPSPWRRRSPSPRRRRSPSPVRRRRQRSTSSSRSRSPIQRRRLSPVRRRFQSPVRRRSPVPVHRRSPSPDRSRSPSSEGPRSPSPVRRRPSSPVRRRSSPGRRRSPVPARRRSPVPARRRSPGPARRRSPTPLSSRSLSPASQNSASPIRRGSVSPLRMKSPRLLKSPRGSPAKRTRSYVRQHYRNLEPAESAMGVRKQPISLSPQRDHSDRDHSRRKVSSVSPSPEKPASDLESLPTQTRSSIEDRRLASPYESPRKRAGGRRDLDDSQSPPSKVIDQRARRASPVRSLEGLPNSRDEVNKYKSTKRESVRSSGEKRRESPDRPVSHRHNETSDTRKKVNEMRSEEVSAKEDRTPKKSPRKGSISGERPDISYPGNGSKPVEKRSSQSKDARDNSRSDSLVNTDKQAKHRSSSVESDSGSEGSDKQRAGVVDKRKRRKSSRREGASDDSSSDSEMEDRKETKRRRKEEKKLRKEERRRRREERRRRKEEKRASKRKRKSKDADISSTDREDNDKDAHGSNGERRSKKYSSEDEETESQKKRLEIELREKALESLRAKKGISR